MLLIIAVATGVGLFNYRTNQLNESREEYRTLIEAKKSLEEDFNKKSNEVQEAEKKLDQTTEENKKLKKDLEAKAQARVRVASVATPKSTVAPAEIRGLVAKYFPANQVENALAIAKCESGLNPTNLNNNPRTGDYSVGLFQINLFGNLAKSRPSEAWLKVAENNIQYAARMSRNGWGAWKNCARKNGLL